MAARLNNKIACLSALTDRGAKRFEQVLAKAARTPVEQVRVQIAAIAASEDCVPIKSSQDVNVEMFPELATREATAVWVDELLTSAGVAAGPGSGSEGLFSWLAMVALPSLCRRNKSGRLAVLELHRYVQSRRAGDFYRHLVSGPYWMRQLHGEHACIFLCQEAYIMPDVQEQMVSRPWIRESRAAVEVVDRLYWDGDTGAPKSGWTSTVRVKNPPPGTDRTQPRPGTLRALEVFLAQLQCTHDIQNMTSEQLIKLLPDEFRPWLDS